MAQAKSRQRDLARVLLHAVGQGSSGIYNVAGDGALGMEELSALLRKPILRVPPWVLRLALRIARPLGLTQYGPEQVRFLQYRPVLSNSALKRDFGYVPHKNSREVFECWRESLKT
ncbi:hypothetical protein [Shimia sp. R11_0]|uniref:hypothetical protein n=1 Tax=Shimia sp. R11_0 TaxID=2821096 RepID=UPI0032AF9050